MVTVQVFKAQQTMDAQHPPEAGGPQGLPIAEMLRPLDAAAVIHAYQGLASIFSRLMATAEADISLGLELGERFDCPASELLLMYENMLIFALPEI